MRLIHRALNAAAQAMSRMRLSHRMAFVLLLPLLLLASVMVQTALGLKDAERQTRTILDTRNQALMLGAHLKDQVHRIAVSSRDLLLTPDEAARAQALMALTRAFSEHDQAFASLSSIVKEEEEMNALIGVSTARNQIESHYFKLMHHVSAGQTPQADQTLKLQIQDQQVAWLGAIDHMGDILRHRSGETLDQIEQVNREVVLRSLALAAVAFGVAALFSVVVARSVQRQLGGEPLEAVQAFERFTAGHFNQPIPVRRGDTHSLMAQAERMRMAMAKIVREVSEPASSGALPDLDVNAIADSVSSQRESFLIAQKAAVLNRAVLHHAAIGMATANPSPSGSFQEVNSTLCQLLQQDCLDIGFLSPADLVAPADLPNYLKTVQSLCEGAIETATLELRLQRKDGSAVWVELNMSMAKDQHKKPQLLIFQVLDLTERHEADRVKAEYISVVSHELRTPLTSIIGSLGLLDGVLGRHLPGQASKLITTARRNSERLLVLINDILDIDKIAAGGMKLELSTQPLGQVVMQAVESTRDFGKRYSVQLEHQDQTQGALVHIDPNRLTQVLVNLLSNAIKYSREGSRVLIRSTCEGGRCRVSVQDFGQGIPEEHKPLLFSKFHQGDAAVTRKKGGTGLGLFISKQLIEQMQGQIGFDSEFGKGSCFWIDLPVQDTAALPALEETNSKPARALTLVKG